MFYENYVVYNLWLCFPTLHIKLQAYKRKCVLLYLDVLGKDDLINHNCQHWNLLFLYTFELQEVYRKGIISY